MTADEHPPLSESAELPPGLLPEDDDERLEPPSSAVFNIPLSPQHLQTFLAVVDAGGRLSSAAQHVGMSQPGVTHQLNELERRLNVQLLDRARGRAARLTRAGRVFERHARGIVQMQAAMYADLERMSHNIGGHVRVGSSQGPGEHWLPPLLLAFRELNPQINLELHISDARSIVEMVFDNEIELGFVGGKWSRSGLQFDRVYRDEFVLIAPPGHPLARRKSLTLGDLADVSYIAQEPGSGLRVTLENELEERGFTLPHFNVLAELGNQESVKSSVMAGYGIGCVWRGSVKAELELGTLAVLNVRDFVPDNAFYVVRRANSRLSRRGIALLEFLHAASTEAGHDTGE